MITDVLECKTLEAVMSTWPVMKTLRTHLIEENYLSQIEQARVQGARLIAIIQEGTCVACAVFRPQFRLYCGETLYVDDLVTLPELRSQGLGFLLVEWIEREGKRLGANRLILDSGIQREAAHRFYKKNGFAIKCFSFEKMLL